MSKGFRDKIFWRPLSGSHGQVWHAYKRTAEPRAYLSLCSRSEILRSGGQECARPPAWLRCGQCDGLELERRGWEESGNESEGWLSYFNFG